MHSIGGSEAVRGCFRTGGNLNGTSSPTRLAESLSFPDTFFDHAARATGHYRRNSDFQEPQGAILRSKDNCEVGKGPLNHDSGYSKLQNLEVFLSEVRFVRTS